MRAESLWLQSLLVHSILLHGRRKNEHLDVGLPVLPFLNLRIHSGSLIWLGYRTWYVFLLWHIWALLRWSDGVYFSQSLVFVLRLLRYLQVVPWVPVPVLWVSHSWCRGKFLDLVWLAPPLSLLLSGTCDKGLVGPNLPAIISITTKSCDLDVSDRTTSVVC